MCMKPTVAGRAEAAKAHGWLWVSPLLWPVPLCGELANEPQQVASARKRESIVTNRVKFIETDHVVDLQETSVVEFENLPMSDTIRTRFRLEMRTDGCTSCVELKTVARTKWLAQHARTRL